MVRKYQRALSARSYRDFSEESLQYAVDAVNNGQSRRKAAVEFGIPRATLNIALECKHNKVGRKFVLSEEEQANLAVCLSLAGEWGFPLNTFDIRLIVKGFLDRSDFTDVDFDDIEDENPAVGPLKHPVLIEKLQPGTYIVVDLVFNKNCKKEIVKQFYAQVIEIHLEVNKVKVEFFCKSSKTNANVYVFLVIDDEMDVDIKDISTLVETVKVSRGRYTFPFSIKN